MGVPERTTSDMRTVIVRDREWAGWIHVAEQTTTSAHELPAARIVIPLDGPIEFDADCGNIRSERAVYVGPQQRCVIGCEGQALTVFLDARSPESRILGRAPQVLDLGVSDRLRAVGLEGCDHLASAGEAMVAELLTQVCVTGRPKPLDMRVEAAMNWLELHSSAPWSMPRLSRRLGVSPSRLAHLFRDDLGISARTLALYYRTFGAVVDIVGGAELAQGAVHAGFSDQAHLARSVRRFFGKTASYVRGGAVRDVRSDV